MAITVLGKNPIKIVTGLTDTNEYIWRVPTGSECTIYCVNQSAGTAIVKYYGITDAPTDFTDFTDSELGSHTATFGEVSEAGVKWIGLDITSGEWDVEVTFTKTT